MLNRLFTFGVVHPLITILILTLITLALAPGIPHLHIDTSLSGLIRDSDPAKEAYDRITEEFGSDNKTIIYLKDDHIWTPEKLQALEDLHFTLEDLPYVQKVDSFYSVRSIRGRDGQIDATTILNFPPVEPEEIATAKDNALYSPLLRNSLINTEGNIISLTVDVLKPKVRKGFNERVHKDFERILEPLRGSVFAEAFQVGPPRVNAEISTGLLADLSLLIPMTVSLLLAVIVVFLRNGMAAVAPLITSLLSLVWMVGFMGTFDIPMNILSAMLPSLVIVIGSTEDTHLISSYLHGLKKGQQVDKRAATLFMMKHMGIPVLLTAITTGLGFSSNIISDIGLMRDFSYAASFAIFANGLVTILLIPLILRFFGPTKNRMRYQEGQPNVGIIGHSLVFVESLFKHHQKKVIAVTLICLATCIAFIPQISVTIDPISYFKHDHSLIIENERIHQDLSGMDVFYVTLESAEQEAFKKPVNLQKLANVQQWIDDQQVFDLSISLVDLLALVNQEFHSGDSEHYVVPKNQDLVEQYLLFFQRQDLESYVSADYQRANMLVRHNVHDSETLNGLVAAIQQQAKKIVGGDIQVYVVGENLMVNAGASSLIQAQVQGVLLMLLVIFIIMSFLFTSFMGGIVSLVPNLIPIILVFGVMGMLGISLNPGTAGVAVIALGIAIDDTIHLMTRYSENCRINEHRNEAILQTVRGEAVPVISTSIALILGFLVLTFSNFTIIVEFGILAAITMFAAMLSDLLITPIVLSRVRLVSIADIVRYKVDPRVLSDSPLFANMSKYQVTKVILLSQSRKYKAGDIILQQGSLGRDMSLLLSGELEVILHKDGKAQHLDNMLPGDVFGEVAFISEVERTAEVRATTDVEVLNFSYDKVWSLRRFYPRLTVDLMFNISRILSQNLLKRI